MGRIASRFLRVEIDNFRSNERDNYRYPSTMGAYFGSHFFLGGGRYESIAPEAFLFGENSDLNYLGTKPVPFPYPIAFGNEPTRALRALINVRKDSVKLVKLPELHSNDPTPVRYTLEFIYDVDSPCTVSVEFCVKEEVSSSGLLRYTSLCPNQCFTPISVSSCHNEVFKRLDLVFTPASLPPQTWELASSQDPRSSHIPVVILVTTDGSGQKVQQQATLCSLEGPVDSGYTLKVLKQKCVLDGVSYLLQEIYGLENTKYEPEASNEEADIGDGEETVSSVKQNDVSQVVVASSEDGENVNTDCIVCMCEPRDTLILPCRHLSLCTDCARSLRFQSNNCPICRAPFRALLQLRGLRQISTNSTSAPSVGLSAAPTRPAGSNFLNNHTDVETDDDSPSSVRVIPSDSMAPLNTVSPDTLPPGYEAVPLMTSLRDANQASKKSSENFRKPSTAHPLPRVKESSKRKKKKDRNPPEVTEPAIETSQWVERAPENSTEDNFIATNNLDSIQLKDIEIDNKLPSANDSDSDVSLNDAKVIIINAAPKQDLEDDITSAESSSTSVDSRQELLSATRVDKTE